MNFTGFNAIGPAGGAKLLSEDELMVIIKLLDTLPPGATLQSVLTTNTTHPVVPILLALNPNQLQQIQQYMAARMRQLSQQFLQPQLLQQVQMQQNVQPKRTVTIQPRPSVLVPPKPNVRNNNDLPDWICGTNNCRAMNVGWRAACCECGTVKPGTSDHFMPHTGGQHNVQHVFHNGNVYDEPQNNRQVYQQPPEYDNYNYSAHQEHQEPLQSYDNTQPSDDYPLEPLGVDVEAPIEEDPNDMEVETFDNTASSIISVKKVVEESPVKQRPPRAVNARANALIPPSMPTPSFQPPYQHEPSPSPMETEQPSGHYEDSQYNSPIERPPISPVLADQEQSNEYEYREENNNQEYNTERQQHRKHDEPLVMSDRTIYVKNIVPVEEEDLERIFRAVGGIRDIRMKRDSRHTTSAFIEYWNKDDAKVAYDTLHGVTLAGQRLQVGWAVARFCKYTGP